MIRITTVDECLNSDVIEKEMIPILGICQWSIFFKGIAKELRRYLAHLQTDLTIIVEDRYVDKVYRDSYYNYYSTKLRDYSRDCLRLSFIASPVDLKDLYTSSEAQERLKSAYRGFMVLRPVYPGCVGRTAISPKALANANVLVCQSPIRCTVLGIHTIVHAFPHSSQDSEMMSCAETSIWAMMEYFGNKYPEYTPILPSKIIKLLENKSDERQIPSHGLTYLNISYVLKSQGFGCKVYAEQDYGAEFRRIFSCYIESGIPIAVALTKEGLGHAVLCVGRTAVPRTAIDAVPPQKLSSGQSIRLWNDAITEFVFIDDNHPCYQTAYFDEPVRHYQPEWNGCKISHFIVPLYKKIYLDAPSAINYAKLIVTLFSNLPKDLVSRTFLASNHTYKDYVVRESGMKVEFKDLLLNKLHFPKFVWVTELSSYDCFLQQKVEGLILLDATEPLSSTFQPFIFANYKDMNLFFDSKKAILENKILPLCSDFNSFDRNLQQ